MVNSKILAMGFLTATIAGIAYVYNFGDTHAQYAPIVDAWTDQARAHCAANPESAGKFNDGECSICGDIKSGALTFDTDVEFACGDGSTATLSMMEAVAQFWMGGAKEHLDAKCGGSVALGGCHQDAYIYFAFMIVREGAADAGSALNAADFGAPSNIDDICAIVNAGGMEDALIAQGCRALSEGLIDGSTPLEYTCADESTFMFSIDDVISSGASLDEHLNALCGGQVLDDTARRLNFAPSQSSLKGHRARSLNEMLASKKSESDEHDAEETEGRSLWGHGHRPHGHNPHAPGGNIVDHCDNGCFGRCGDGCNCWSSVCGDCRNHQGCQEHDYYCSCKGMWHGRCLSGMACSRTCNWPGCSASFCAARNGAVTC